MIHGFDISHHNGVNAVQNCISIMEKKDKSPTFCFIKATEGKTFVDKRFTSNMTEAGLHNLIRGAYHFARPDLNSAKDEAINFITQFKPYIGKAIPIIDWEGEAEKYSGSWAYEWCSYVKEYTGSYPMIYCGIYELRKMKKLVDMNCGLWIARWRQFDKGPGNVLPWRVWSCWQYTSEPFDMNVFNGTVEQLAKYMVSDTFSEDCEKECSVPDCKCGCHIKKDVFDEIVEDL